MRKDGSVNLTRTGKNEIKRNSCKHHATYLERLCEWMSDLGLRDMVKNYTLFRYIGYGKLWGALIAHVLKKKRRHVLMNCLWKINNQRVMFNKIWRRVNRYRYRNFSIILFESWTIFDSGITWLKSRLNWSTKLKSVDCFNSR